MSTADAASPEDRAASDDPLDTPGARTAIDTLRFLAVDMVQAANSGHPGAPMGQAPMAYLLYSRFLRIDPTAPEWPNRDRFVLSCGHASALLYGVLHLAGYDLSLDELRRFRQLGSKTPGHPETGHTPGVDTTTGPLGQGISNAVGMAMAQRVLAERFNRDRFELFDFDTWVLASDGDLMEGVASEACSLAGHLRLGKLNVLYDANHISIDGSTDLAFTEDVGGRFRAYGWHTLEVDDGTDLAALEEAMSAAREEERPTLITVRTVIGYGSPNRAGTAKAHGEPLGAEEAKLAKENLDWPLEPSFHVPEQARLEFARNRERGQQLHAEWKQRLESYREAHPELAAELDRRLAGELPHELETSLPEFETGVSMATRKASGKVLESLKDAVPELLGGSADLTGSNNTWLDGEAVYSAAQAGRNIHFGVREHAMAAALNGMALTGLLRPYGGTFLIFSDYLRPAIRLAALMEQPSIFVLTHDSVFLGEDGPTHQPISQLAALRAIPNTLVLRPADANETAGAWQAALEHQDGPSCLILTRQSLPVLGQAKRGADGVGQGGYVISDADGEAQAILIATGSEVSLALEAQQRLAESGTAVRVVSLPSWELFARQSRALRDQVLPPEVTARLAIEAGSPFGWERWVGTTGDVLCMEGFGASAPFADLKEHFGFTVENVVERLQRLL